MALSTQKFDISGPMVLTPSRFGDNRGFFSETYSERAFAEAGIADRFCQDNHSLSQRAGTVRGLHCQKAPNAQAKLVRVIRGSILDVAVDVRLGSPTYGRHVAAVLSAENWHQMYVPVGFLHGFCTLEDSTEVTYKVSAAYAPEDERGVVWNDANLAIEWPSFAGAEVSLKDQALPSFSDFVSPFGTTA